MTGDGILYEFIGGASAIAGHLVKFRLYVRREIHLHLFISLSFSLKEIARPVTLRMSCRQPAKVRQKVIRSSQIKSGAGNFCIAPGRGWHWRKQNWGRGSKDYNDSSCQILPLAGCLYYYWVIKYQRNQ